MVKSSLEQPLLEKSTVQSNPKRGVLNGSKKNRHVVGDKISLARCTVLSKFRMCGLFIRGNLTLL